MMGNSQLTQSHLLLRALRQESVERPPVWIYRQAGRYLPEYRAVRNQHPDFITMCKIPEVAAQLSCQPLERFSLDASIIFSDILTIADAMGMRLQFNQSGPFFDRSIQTHADIDALDLIGLDHRLDYVPQAITLLREHLNGSLPIIGFCASPWTLACYMMQGHASKQWMIARGMCYQHQDVVFRLLDIIAQASIDYLSAQINAGAQVIMLFDTFGGLLNQDHYRAYVIDRVAVMIEVLKQRYRHVPIILFSKGCASYLKMMSSIGLDGIALDWTVCMQTARSMVGESITLQGNIDPAMLLGSNGLIRDAVCDLIHKHGPKGLIVNLGHGIFPNSDPKSVKAFVDAVVTYRGQVNQ